MLLGKFGIDQTAVQLGQHISDINNTINNSGASGSQGGYFKHCLNTGNWFGNFYNQVVVAFNQPGEYVYCGYKC